MRALQGQSPVIHVCVCKSNVLGPTALFLYWVATKTFTHILAKVSQYYCDFHLP